MSKTFKIKDFILFLLLVVAISIVASLTKINAQPKNAWEIGLQGTAWNYNITDNVTSAETQDGTKVSLELKSVAYTGGVYVGKELSNTFAVDFQGNLGKVGNDLFSTVGVGLQYRIGSYFIKEKDRSPYIDPFFRAGIDYMYRGYDITYMDDDGRLRWRMFNINNSDGKDVDHLLPLRLSVGVNMWLNDKWGVRTEASYSQIFRNNIPSVVHGTVGVVRRFGGASKVKREVIELTNTVYEIREVERIVVRVDTVFTGNSVTINEIMSQIYFDFNSYEVKPEYNDKIRQIVEYINQDGGYYIISGQTDIVGSQWANLVLSTNRAKSVRQALAQEGVQYSKIKIVGNGSKIALMPAREDETIRSFDRKIIFEKVPKEIFDKLPDTQ